MSRSREVVKESLQKKGFKLKEGDHMYFVYYSLSGKKTSINTKLSRESNYKMLQDNLLALICKQCKLSKQDLLRLIDCPLSQEEYEAKLKNQSISLT